MKRIKALSLILSVILILTSTVVYGTDDSFELNLKPLTTSVSKGDTLKLSIMLENFNITGGEQGIGAVSAKISYKEDIFELISVKSDVWEISENEGAIVANSKDANVVKENTNIGEIELKVKENAELGSTTLKFENIEGASPDTVVGTGKETTINITEKVEKQLTGIDVTKYPDKISYKVGESFTTSGMEVTAKYSDGSYGVVNNYTYSPDGALTADDKEITITYTEGNITQTAKVPIEVTDKVIVEIIKLGKIEVTKNPDKTTYKPGEKFDPTGMVVEAIYTDGTRKIIDNYTYSPNGELTASDKEITIKYQEEGQAEKEFKLPITVTSGEQKGEDDKTQTNVESNGINQENNKTESDKKIPQTGVAGIAIPSLIVIVLVVIAGVCYKKYKAIK